MQNFSRKFLGGLSPATPDEVKPVGESTKVDFALEPAGSDETDSVEEADT